MHLKSRLHLGKSFNVTIWCHLLYLEGLAKRVQFLHTSLLDEHQGCLHRPRNHNYGPNHQNVSKRSTQSQWQIQLRTWLSFYFNFPLCFTLLSLGLIHSISQSSTIILCAQCNYLVSWPLHLHFTEQPGSGDTVRSQGLQESTGHGVLQHALYSKTKSMQMQLLI